MRARPLHAAVTAAAVVVVIIGGAALLTDRTTIYLGAGEELLGTDPTVVLGAESPEPEFDTSTLGLESPLAPMSLSEALDEIASYPSGGELIRLTILGATPEGYKAMVVHAEVEDQTLGQIQTRCIFTAPGGSSCSGISAAQAAEMPGGLVPGEPNSGPSYSAGSVPTKSEMVWEVPRNASVVTLTVNSETRWQRPVGNVAVFVTAFEYGDQFELVALGIQGNPLLSIARTVSEDG